MNVKRFAARTSREALALVRQAFGVDAVVLSTKPCAEGIEVLAMAPDSVAGLERVSEQAEKVTAAPAPAARPAQRAAAPAAAPRAADRGALAGAQRELAARIAPPQAEEVASDADQLAMSTLSFQDYVRDRMLKRRHAELHNAPVDEAPAAPPESLRSALAQSGAARTAMARAAARQQMLEEIDEANDDHFDAPPPAPARRAAPMSDAARRAAAPQPAEAPRRAPVRPTVNAFVNAPVLHDEVAEAAAHASHAAAVTDISSRRGEVEMMNELRSMKGLIEERFGALAFMEKLQRQPRQALLAQKLLDVGFSPALIRKMVDALPATAADENAWAAGVLERNLVTNEHEMSLEDQGGVYALIGSTGVGKTTTTAKIAAGFAARHGANQLGLITLDAYRVGAHEQLRAYGRILGVPVHTAHDRASLEDLLELLAGKKMVLIDTAGMAQRDGRTRELLDMLSHRSIQKVLVVDASSQGETIDDVVVSWKASQCKGVILSKIDEAVKLAPALDTLIRHKLKNIGIANGQRVPEDWHRLSANALVHRAMKGGGSAAWRMDTQDVHLVFAHAGMPSGASTLRA